MSRRRFMKQVTVTSIAGISGIAFPSVTTTRDIQEKTPAIRPKVLFFDVNETLLDLNGIKDSVGMALGGQRHLLPLWFTTMLQYSLVATVGRHYEDFGSIGAAALRMVAANNGIVLTEQEAKNAIIKPIQSLPPHPDVKASLHSLKVSGYTLVSFTNSSNQGVATQLKNAGLTDYFAERLSVEDIGKFKPHTDAYAWAARKLQVPPQDCMLIAAHGWDVAGALWAHWRAAFVARPGQQLYPLAPTPEISLPSLSDIAQKLIAMKSE